MRFVPVEAPLEAIVSAYLKSRKARFPAERAGPGSPHFVDRHGGRLRRGGAQYLVASAYRTAGVGARANRTYQVLERITKPSPSPTTRPTRKASPPGP